MSFKRLLLNKYLVVLTLFTVFVTFFDNHSLLQRWKSYRRIHLMESELEYYQNEIVNTKRKMKELQSDKESLEKFAREHYYMKRTKEDIFIVK